jgi:hypothetical protein
VTTSIYKMLSRVIRAPAPLLLAAWPVAPARVQIAPTVLRTMPSAIGLTLTLSSSSPSDAMGVDNTYNWTAINNFPEHYPKSHSREPPGRLLRALRLASFPAVLLSVNSGYR